MDLQYIIVNNKYIIKLVEWPRFEFHLNLFIIIIVAGRPVLKALVSGFSSDCLATSLVLAARGTGSWSMTCQARKNH